MEHIAG